MICILCGVCSLFRAFIAIVVLGRYLYPGKTKETVKGCSKCAYLVFR